MGIRIRKSKVSDYPSLNSFDEFMGDRRIDIERGELLIADYDSIACIGYAKITSNEFFNKPLISIVNVQPQYRGKGVAKALIRAAVESATWEKVYLTTELSNTKMQSLLKNIGFVKVGDIEGFNVDGEAELIFCITSVD